MSRLAQFRNCLDIFLMAQLGTDFLFVVGLLHKLNLLAFVLNSIIIIVKAKLFFSSH
jgi:hypothetical protein